MTRKWTCGFETWDTDVVEGIVLNGATIQNTVLISGTATVKCDSGAGNATATVITSANNNNLAATAGYVRYRVRYANLPSTNAAIFHPASDVANNGPTLTLNTDGTLTWSGGGSGWTDTIPNVVIGINKTYVFEFHFIPNTASGGNDTIEMKINGKLVYSTTTGQGWDQATANPISTIQAGWYSAPGANKICYLDDFAFNDTGGSDNNSWCGPGRVVLALPTSDINRVGWTGGVGGTTNLFDAVNNTPPIGTATETDLTQIEHPGGAAGINTDYVVFALTDWFSLGVQPGARVGTGCQYAGSSTGIGNVAGQTKCATRFRASRSSPLKRLELMIGKTGNPTDNLVISIQTESAAAPSGTVLWTTSIAGTSIAASESRTLYPMINLTANSLYWIVMERSGSLDAVNYYSQIYPKVNKPGGGGASYLDASAAYSFQWNGTNWINGAANTLIAFNAVWRDGDFVNLLQLFAETGEDVATGTKQVSVGIGPTFTNSTGGTTEAAPYIETADVTRGSSGALGTYPTGWWRWRMLPQFINGAIDSDNGMDMSVSRPETASRVASICFLGVQVDYTERRAPPPIMLHRPNSRVWRRRVG